MASNKFVYKFLTEPDDSLKCSICLEVAKGQPKQHEVCGKLFCSECIEKNGNKPCPNCRAENPKYFNDVRSLREIKALPVRCDNVERGCDWEGTVGMLEGHVTKCGLTLVPCSNKCKVAGKDLLVMRRDLDNHLKTQCTGRDYKCKHCGEKGTYANITEVHDNICTKKIVPCPNIKCAMTMERGKTNEHVQTVCDYTLVACKHESIGCSEKKKIRKDMKQHEKDSEIHLHLSLEKIAQLNSTVSSSKSEIASLKIEITALKDSLLKKISSLKKTTSSKMDFEKLEDEITSLKKTESSLKKEVSSLKDTTSSLKDTTSSLKDTTSSLKKDADTLNKDKEKSTTFKLTEYSEKKESSAIFTSESFFTSLGYKMSIRVDANGCGEGDGTHVSVFSQLLEGPYDDQLHWPFGGTVTFELLNQLADDNHHGEVIEYIDNECARAGGSGWGKHQFIPHSELFSVSNTQYLMEDTLYFRVTVKEKDHKPWLDCTHHTETIDLAA